MKKTSILKRLLSLVVCVVLIAAMGLTLTSCGEDKKETPSETSSLQSSEVTPGDGYGNAAEDVGQGKVSFIFRITDKDGYDTLYRVHTNDEYVGKALLKNGLIAGEDGEHGLYVKVVGGVTADYNTDKAYWAFYINNEYAMTGVDKTKIEKDAEYCFKYTKDE